MSGGDILKQNELMTMNIFDFWAFYDRFKIQKEKENEQLKNSRNGKR